MHEHIQTQYMIDEVNVFNTKEGSIIHNRKDRYVLRYLNFNTRDSSIKGQSHRQELSLMFSEQHTLTNTQNRERSVTVTGVGVAQSRWDQELKTSLLDHMCALFSFQ